MLLDKDFKDFKDFTVRDNSRYYFAVLVLVSTILLILLISTRRINVALRKVATQSSLFSATANSPSFAVDGITDGSTNIVVSCTLSEKNAWWQVDLGRAYSIEQIKIWNRTDCCSGALSDFDVLVSDTPFTQNSTIFTFYVPGPAGTPTILPVRESGRYVRVQLRNKEYLALAEVEVLADVNPWEQFFR